MSYCFTVGMKGFEPSTTWSQTRHSNRTELHPESFSSLKSGAKVRFYVKCRKDYSKKSEE